MMRLPVEAAVIVTELGVELHDAKLVCDMVTAGWSEGVRLRFIGPASGLHVNLTVVLALPGAE